MPGPRTLVVGAGAIGLACAYSLARRGREVVLIDRGEPGAACTRGNAGWIVPSMSAPIPAPALTATSIRWMLSSDSPLYIAPTAVPGLARWLWRFWRHCNARDFDAGLRAVAALNRGTLAAFDALARDGVDFELHRDGVLCVFEHAAYMESSRRDFEALRDFGYAVPAALGGDALWAMEPALSSTVTAGFFTPEEYHVRPESLATGYTAALARMGVTLHTGVAVRGVRTVGRTVGRTVVLQTSDGDIEGDELLVAAGAWSGEVVAHLGARLPVQAGKGYSLTIPGEGGRVSRPVYFGESRIAVTPFDGALRLAGSMELSGINERLDARRMAAIRRGAARSFRDPLPAGGTEWVGMRPLTPDGLPMLGRVPGQANVWVATGHAMLGVTLAPVTGEAMADLMTGAAAPAQPAMMAAKAAPATMAAMAAFDPGRFRW